MMSFVAQVSKDMDIGQAYGLLLDLLQVVDGGDARPRLQVVACDEQTIKMEFLFAGGITPQEYQRRSTALCSEISQLLMEIGEWRVRLSY